MQLFQCNVVNISKAVFLRLVFVVLFLWLVTAPNLLWAKPPAKDFLMACYSGTIEEVQQAIAAGADVSAVSAQGSTPLMAAILGRTGSLKKVEMLLAAKADPNIKQKWGDSWIAINYAISDNSYNLNLIKLLLEAMTAVNTVGHSTPMPISLADACIFSKDWSDKNQALLLKEFIKYGADIHQKSELQKQTALQICAARSGPESMKVLLEAGAEVDAMETRDGYTALHTAAQSNPYPENIILLLDHGANPDQRDQRNRTALDLAFDNPTPGAPHIQAILSNPQSQPQWWLSEPPTVDDLLLLSYLGTAEEVKKAIDAGIEVNFVSKQGYTPLSLAIKSKVDSLKKINLLLTAKASPNLKNKNGKTPLHLAISNTTDLEIVKRLLEAKADINALDNEETSPFILAASSAYTNSGRFGKGWPAEQHAKLLKLMLENGADTSFRHRGTLKLNRRFGDAGNALIFAAAESGPKSLQILIETGLDVNEVASPSGHSALLDAVQFNTYPESISLLLESGADPNYVYPYWNMDVLSFIEMYGDIGRPERITTERIKEILREAVNK